MATVHWPRADLIKSGRLKASIKLIENIPFILTADGAYPEGINEYIYERVRGKVGATHGAKANIALKPLSRNSAYKLASSLADLLTWAETKEAHPSLGVIEWRDIRAWQIRDLYADALLQGYWTAHFFSHRDPSPLAPNTIKAKINAQLGCYHWMSTGGFDEPFIRSFDEEPQLHTIMLARDACLLSYRREMRERIVNGVSVPQRSFRRAPGSLPLPTLEHLQRFFEAIPGIPHRLAAMQMFETGMRAEEVVENTLLPGEMHQRDFSGAWYIHPDWPRIPYTLEYSLSDNRMIGVVPTREMAWFEEARLGYQCDYKILGKNKTLRLVHMPPALLRRVYKYADSAERDDLEARRFKRGLGKTAHVYLNRFGDKLSYHAIWEAFDRANEKIKAPVDLTPHLLRHAYACYFLEQAIAEQARAMGKDPLALPPEIVMQIGNTVLLTIQQELGHAEFTTTRKYLQQIASGRVRLQALELWNAFLDTIEVEDA